ncbi:MAG: HEAT repeat domain-containing protein [Candidatus Aureabacteria bacterium]|nr:HEAT repeat domain-containing protein [Candidatus Auribacterota bacterium]
MKCSRLVVGLVTSMLFSAACGWSQPGGAQMRSLIKLLGSPDHKQRKEAVKMLGNAGSKEAVPALINTLRMDSNNGVRKEAAEALGSIGDRKAVEPLLHALNDQDGGVRRNAARSLGVLGDPRAIKPLLQMLVETEDPWMIDACQGSLKQLGYLDRIEVRQEQPGRHYHRSPK